MFRDRDGWRVQWRVGEKRFSRKFESKSAARLFEAQLNAGVLQNPTDASMTFSDFADRWMTDYCKIEKAESQWVGDESVIRKYLKPALGNLRLSEISQSHLETFRRELKKRTHAKTGRPLSIKTINLILALLKKILGTAVDWEVIGKNPGARIKLFPQPEQVVGCWTGEERDRFYAFARHKDPEFARMVMVACHTGLRRGELAALQRYQLDFAMRQITVSASFCFKSGKRLDRTKTGRVGWVPMNDVVMDLLSEFRTAGAECEIFGTALLRHSAQRLGRLCKAVGMRPIRMHDTRHTFGSTLANVGIDAHRRQKLMRHKTIAMTDRYTHFEPSVLAGAVASLARNPARGEREISGRVENL